MGLFSSKTKTVIGIQAFDLGTDGCESFYKFRTDALFASAGNIKAFQKAMYNYKNSVRRAYSSNRLQRFGMPPVSTPFSYVTSNLLTDVVKNRDDIYAVQDLAQLQQELNDVSVIVNSGNLTEDSLIPASDKYSIKVLALCIAKVWNRGDTFDTDFNKGTKITEVRYEHSPTYNKDCFRVGYNSEALDNNDWIGIELDLTAFKFNSTGTVDTTTNTLDGKLMGCFTFDCTLTSENRRNDGSSTTEGYSVYRGTEGTSIDDDDHLHNFGCFPTSQTEHHKVMDDDYDYTYKHQTTISKDEYTWDIDMGYYYYAAIKIAKSIVNKEQELYTPIFSSSIYFLDYSVQDALASMVTVSGTYDAEPLFNVKDHTKSAEVVEQEEAGMSEEEKKAYRLKRFYNKKILDTFSINMDSFVAQLKNDDLKEISVGLLFDFSKVGKSQSVLSTLFNSLEIILPNDRQLLSNNLMGSNYYPADPKDRLTLIMPFGSGDIKAKFVLQRRTYTESVAEADKRYAVKLKAKAKETNAVKNRPEAVELYEAYFGEDSSNGKTLLVMRSDVITEYTNTEEDDRTKELKDAYTLFPSKRSCMAIYGKRYFTGQLISKPTSVVDAVTKLSALGDEISEELSKYDGILFSAREIPMSVPDTYFELVKTKGKLVGFRVSAELGSGLNTVYKVLRKNSATNTVTEFILSDLYSYFSDGTYTSVKKFTENSASGDTFFLPSASGVLNNMKFYDYIEAKDIMLSGIIFSVQKIKIKWYQQEWFAWVLIIVAVVIAVVTVGAGSSISAGLVTLAEGIIVSYAIAKAIEVIAPMVGLDPNDVRLVVAIASIIYGDASAAIKLLQLADALMKRELQEEIEKLQNIKKDMKKFEAESDKLMRLAQSDSDSSKIHSLWSIVENINNKQKNNKVYTLEELEYMAEIDKYTVPFKPIYLEDPSKTLLARTAIPSNTELHE